jgi:L-iduronidase
MKITVDCSKPAGRLQHFWPSTGFTPAKWLLRPDMKQTLGFAGGTACGGMRFVRIHWLLDLVKATGLEGGAPAYDFADLDEGLDRLAANGLKPFFELMGRPSEFFNDFSQDAQVRAWKRLIHDLAVHLMDRYGRDEVESWYFETWNEPDSPGWWKQFTDDPPAFCNYYDACSEGLREANPNLRFGGPGTCRDLSETLKALLAHCDAGRNYFTGEAGVRLDFISVHVKGAKATAEDINPDSMRIIEREREIIEYIRREHPRLADRPFMNDECDPQVGWWDIHSWRGKTYHAAIAAKIINQHVLCLADELGVNYALLSNDNGFMGSWGNRTQLARLGRDEQVERGEFALIKKPVLSLLSLLALLGEERVAVAGVGGPEADVGAIATRGAADGAEQIAILLYNCPDRIASSGRERIDLRLEGVPFERPVAAHWRLDEDHGEAFAAWERLGAPNAPSGEQLAEIRRHQEPELILRRRVNAVNGQLRLRFDMPVPSVSLVLLATQPEEKPAKVGGLEAEVYPGLHGRDVMLTWRGLDSRLVRTYEVLAAERKRGPFRRVNDADTISSAFVDAPGEGGASCYKVRAIDLWGRKGRMSDAVVVE